MCQSKLWIDVNKLEEIKKSNEKFEKNDYLLMSTNDRLEAEVKHLKKNFELLLSSLITENTN